MIVGWVVQAEVGGEWITYVQWRHRERAAQQARDLLQRKGTTRVRLQRVEWREESAD
jgi:hypothetical protein